MPTYEKKEDKKTKNIRSRRSKKAFSLNERSLKGMSLIANYKEKIGKEKKISWCLFLNDPTDLEIVCLLQVIKWTQVHSGSNSWFYAMMQETDMTEQKNVFKQQTSKIWRN